MEKKSELPKNVGLYETATLYTNQTYPILSGTPHLLSVDNTINALSFNSYFSSVKMLSSKLAMVAG